jgi:hypothetical protein
MVHEYSLIIIPRVGKVMSIIFVVLSRMSPTFEFEYHECVARVVFSSVGDMSENTTKIVYLTLAKSGIRGTIQQTKFILNFLHNHH